MGDRDHGWTTVGHMPMGQRLRREEEAELELREREVMIAWDNDSQWPGM